MGVRTVRLDAESERALLEIQQRAGLSVSGALKRGLVTVREALRSEAAASPYEIYRTIDLGPGGYTRAPARRAKAGVREVLRARSRRDPG
jgi:hypothetical protein